MLDIEKLKELRSSGAISEQEFLEQKHRLFRQIERENESVGAKNGILYILLAWFLGTIGIHNFYAGYVGRGVVQMLLTLTSWLFLFIPVVVVALWVLLEIFFVNKGANGVFFKGSRKLIWLLRIGAIIWLVSVFYYSDLVIYDQSLVLL